MAAVTSAPVFAHSGHSGSGFIATLFHPFTGLDHLLSLIAAGACIALYYKTRSRSR